MYCWKANFLSFQMRPVFSNISYSLRTKFTFIYLSFKIVWGVLRALRNLEIQKSKLLLSLEILSNDAPKEKFSDCVNDKEFGFVVKM